MYKRYILISIVLIVLLFIFFMFRFHGSSVQYNGKRPCDYPNTYWVSKNTGAEFYVVKSDKSDNYHCKGKLTKSNGETVEFEILFDNAGGVEFWKDNSNRVLMGSVPSFLTISQFYEDKLVITNITEDKLFNNEYDEIVFKRM